MQIPINPQEINWSDLLTQFSPLADLENCPQDPVFHGEGNVLIHTKMVVEALMTSDYWQRLDSSAQQIMFMAALFHDIAKPICTVEENGRIVSPKHAVKGASLSQKLLYQDWLSNLPPLTLATRQLVVELVRFHGLPLWFWDKPDMVHSVVNASLHVRCDWIAQLAEADVKGRICKDQDELLDRVELFREFCAEQNCLSHAYEFASDHSRFRYFAKGDQHPALDIYDDTLCEVTLMSGLPGSGKDTWLREHKPNIPIVSLDALRRDMGIDAKDNQGPVIARAKDQARDYLRKKQDFAWNATNITKRMRSQLIDLFTDYQARVRITYLEAPWREVLHRNQVREEKVPLSVLNKMVNQLEIPDATEAHYVDWFETSEVSIESLNKQ